MWAPRHLRLRRSKLFARTKLAAPSTLSDVHNVILAVIVARGLGERGVGTCHEVIRSCRSRNGRSDRWLSLTPHK